MRTKHQQGALTRSKKLGVAAFGLAVFAAQACTVGAGEESVDNFDQAYGSCGGLRAWDGGNWQFTVQQGEVIQHNGTAYQANVAISYPNAECAPDNPVSWCANWFTNLGPCDASSSPTQPTSTSSPIPLECYANTMIDMYNAELAVAMARELGELNPVRDLEIVNVNGEERVALRASALSRCSAESNQCDNTKAILELQDSAVNNVIDQDLFNATSFRSTLVSQWRDQASYEANFPDRMPDAHSLTLRQTSSAYCGTFYEFQVNWECASSGSSSGAISLEAENFSSKRAGGSDNFNQNGGAMVCGPNDGSYWTSGWGSSAPKLSYNVNFPNGGTYYVWVLAKAATGSDDSMHAGVDGQENTTADKMTTGTFGSYVWTNQTMDGAPATINVGSGNHSFDLYAREDGIEVDKIVLTQDPNYNPATGGGSSSGGSCSGDTSEIQERMMFFRPNNSVIDFQSTSTSIRIDPTGTLNGGGSTSSGSCKEACSLYSRNWSNLIGECCTCEGEMGTFKKVVNRIVACK